MLDSAKNTKTLTARSSNTKSTTYCSNVESCPSSNMLEVPYKQDLSNFVELVKIIENRSLVSYSQSIHNIHSQQYYGSELLVRGPANSSLFLPNELFSAAFKLDKSGELEALCLEVHLENIKQHPRDQVFTINISPKMLLDSKTLRLLKGCERASQIKLELTEHYPVQDWTPIKVKMTELRELGYEFWLDDVGCGFFNLALVNEVKTEAVKLCTSLMNKFPDNKKFLSDIKTMVETIHRYGGKVLAEGIENQKQLLFAKQLGIDYAQGFFFDKPKMLR